MVRRSAVNQFQVNVRRSGLRERAEEILHQLGLEIAYMRCRDFEIAHAIRAAGKIERRGRETIVHRHQKIAGAQNPALRSERLFHGLAERDSHVFNGVVLIHVEVAARRKLEIERRRAAQSAPACGRRNECPWLMCDLPRPSRFRRRLNVRFLCRSAQVRFSHRIASNSRSRRRV